MRIFQGCAFAPRFSGEHLLQVRKLDALREQHEAKKAERDESWAKFLDDLRANPAQLSQLPAPKPENVDGRLFALWQLLQSMSGETDRHAIDSVAALDQIAGTAVTTAFRDAFIGFWRQWRAAT